MERLWLLGHKIGVTVLLVRGGVISNKTSVTENIWKGSSQTFPIEWRVCNIYTEHQARTSKYAQYLLKAIGKENWEIVVNAASVHDIGKKFVKKEILEKVGLVSKEDFQELKKHVEKDFLTQHKVLQQFEEKEILNVILSHHERWDGQGYPNRLKREEIPLEARIVTLVDSWDAITSPRIYGIAYSFEEAIEEIILNSGEQFDPILVKAFLKDIEKLKDITARTHKN